MSFWWPDKEKLRAMRESTCSSCGGDLKFNEEKGIKFCSKCGKIQ